jgi:hypothetical protein
LKLGDSEERLVLEAVSPERSFPLPDFAADFFFAPPFVTEILAIMVSSFRKKADQANDSP